MYSCTNKTALIVPGWGANQLVHSQRTPSCETFQEPFPGAVFSCFHGWIGKGMHVVCTVHGCCPQGQQTVPVLQWIQPKTSSKAGWSPLPLAYKNLLWVGTIYQYLLEKHRTGNFLLCPRKKICAQHFSREVYFVGVYSLEAYFLPALLKASCLRNCGVSFLCHSGPYFTPDISWDCFFGHRAELTHLRILPCRVFHKCRWTYNSIYLFSRCLLLVAHPTEKHFLTHFSSFSEERVKKKSLNLMTVEP